MNPQRFRSIMTAELSQLRREGLLDESTFDTLSERYSPTQWNWASMGRWFAIFGGLCTAAGICIVAADLFEMTLRNLAWALTLTTAALLWGGYRLKQSRMKWTALSLEMCASLAIIGLTFTLGIIFSTGSGNWPMLLLIDLFVLLPLAYLLRNVLVLIVTAVVFFTWFGGMTGYVSGWGAYWFGMNYPMRFLLAGILIALIGVLHRQAESGWLRQYRNFFKVWLSSGVFFANMALWLMSLFGNFSTIYGRHLETAAELVMFNLMWIGFNAALLYLGTRFGLRMLRAYGVTFLIIQAYTLYFWKVAGHMDPVLATFLAGSVTLWMVWKFETRRRRSSEDQDNRSNPPEHEDGAVTS